MQWSAAAFEFVGTIKTKEQMCHASYSFSQQRKLYLHTSYISRYAGNINMILHPHTMQAIKRRIHVHSIYSILQRWQNKRIAQKYNGHTLQCTADNVLTPSDTNTILAEHEISLEFKMQDSNMQR
mmetsp:Transcript_4523/g.12602  ORF Transcript_4523/g.12602 Transcript_4523/m.12602 type:complete len:125 (+) Transcript_4523:510-884(+)